MVIWLLAWVGCHTDAYEQAKWFGDDTPLKRDAHYGYDMGKAGPAIWFMLRHVGGPERPLATRARTGVAFVHGRRAQGDEGARGDHYRATDDLAAQLGLGEDVRESLRQSYERWDGQGAYGLKGEEGERRSADSARGPFTPTRLTTSAHIPASNPRVMR